MTHMLVMAARQLGDPVVFIVFMVTGDGLFHTISVEPEFPTREEINQVAPENRGLFIGLAEHSYWPLTGAKNGVA